MSIAPSMIGSAVTQEEAHALATLARDQSVLELGAGVGRSTLALSSTARLVVSVDWHWGDPEGVTADTLPLYLRMVRKHPNIVPVIGRFETVLPMLKPDWFDGAFIDGWHREEDVRRDAELAMMRVRVGGWLAFHDYGRFDVSTVVDRIGKPQGLAGTLAWIYV